MTAALPAPTHRLRVGSWSTVGQAWDQVRAQFVSGLRILRSPHRHPVAAIIAIAWAVGILGDAATTTMMMSSGISEEGNPAAAGLMGLVGVEGWVLSASVICLGLAVLSLGRAPGLYAATVRAMCLLAGAVKVYIAVSNVLLWMVLAG